VLELNRSARARIRGEAELYIVDGATHWFEEPGRLDEMTDVAAAWFQRHLIGARARTLWNH